jgi:hypothetical protein
MKAAQKCSNPQEQKQNTTMVFAHMACAQPENACPLKVGANLHKAQCAPGLKSEQAQQNVNSLAICVYSPHQEHP